MSFIDIFLDTETTGLKPGQIAQISAIKVCEHKIIDKINMYFEVEHVCEDAAKVTGRGAEDYRVLSGGIKFNDRADEIANFLRGAQIYGYNINFDNKFIKAEFKRTGRYKVYEAYNTGAYDEVVLTANDVMDKASKHINLDSLGIYKKKAKLSELISGLKLNEKKIEQFTASVFGLNETVSFHDATFDTVCTYILNRIIDELIESDYTMSRTMLMMQ